MVIPAGAGSAGRVTTPAAVDQAPVAITGAAQHALQVMALVAVEGNRVSGPRRSGRVDGEEELAHGWTSRHARRCAQAA